MKWQTNQKERGENKVRVVSMGTAQGIPFAGSII